MHARKGCCSFPPYPEVGRCRTRLAPRNREHQPSCFFGCDSQGPRALLSHVCSAVLSVSKPSRTHSLSLATIVPLSTLGNVQARSSNRSPPSQVAYPCPVGLCCKWSPPSQGQADRAGKTTCPTPSVCSLSRSLRVAKWAFSHQEPGQPGGRRQVTSYPTGANRPQLRARPSVRKRRRPTSLGCSFGDDWAGRADLDQG